MIDLNSVNTAITSSAIEHSRFAKALSMLDDFIADTSMEASRGLLLTGPQGAGKSEICKSLLIKYPPEQVVRPVAYVPVPEIFQGKTLLQEILKAFGRDDNSQETECFLKKLVVHTIFECRTNVLVLDDTHNLLRHVLARDSVRRLMDETGIKVVLVGRDHSKDLLNSDMSLQRRFPILVELSAWNPQSEEDICEVLAVLQRFVSQSGVQLDYRGLINTDFARRLVCGSGGRIKDLVELFSSAVLHANSRGSETLEDKDFEQAFGSLQAISKFTRSNPFSESFGEGQMKTHSSPVQVAS